MINIYYLSGVPKVPPCFSNIIEKGGALVYEAPPDEAWLKLEKSGKIIWVDVLTGCEGECYDLTIVEKEKMVQEVVADPKSLASDICSTGHVSVYGIHFDFNKATVKAESEPTLKEIAKLLEQNPDLNLYVVGHTDNAGKFDYNMQLPSEMETVMTKNRLICGLLVYLHFFPRYLKPSVSRWRFPGARPSRVPVQGHFRCRRHLSDE